MSEVFIAKALTAAQRACGGFLRASKTSSIGAPPAAAKPSQASGRAVRPAITGPAAPFPVHGTIVSAIE